MCQTSPDHSVSGAKFDATKMIVVCPVCNLENYLAKNNYDKRLDCCHCAKIIWDGSNHGIPDWLKGD